METRTYTVYKFDELPEEGKKKALENLYYINVDGDYWYEHIFDEWTEKLEAHGFMQPKISFSGFASQGDGACFDIQSFDAKAFIEANNLQGRFHAILKFPSAFDGHIQKNAYATHYSHYNTRFFDYSIELSETDDGSMDDEERKEFNGEYDMQASDLMHEAEAVRATFSKEIYRDLEKEYDYQTSEEAIIETIRANDYDFTEDGKID